LKNSAYANKEGIKYDDATISHMQLQLSRLSQRPYRIQHFLALEILPKWQTDFKDSKGLSLLDLQRIKNL